VIGVILDHSNAACTEKINSHIIKGQFQPGSMLGALRCNIRYGREKDIFDISMLEFTSLKKKTLQKSFNLVKKVEFVLHLPLEF